MTEPASRTPRLDKLLPADLDTEQRALHDVIANGPRAQGRQAFRLTDDGGALEGPFNAMLLSPRLGGALQALGSAVRYGSTLSDRVREIAILVVAYSWHSDFERHAHEAVALAAGVTDNELEMLRAGRFGELSDPTERLTAVTAHALATRHDLDDREYANAEAGLGAAALFEVTTIVGYYATLALQLRVYRVAAPR
jgi:4-carboxymuconolactone decarboxylase